MCLRCNVDYQYQIRTFPQQEVSKEATADGASEHTSVHPDGQKQAQTLPGILGWLVRRASTAKAQTVQLLASFAVGMRSSAVADFYATKYLAKPQQWLTSVLGPLIAGFKRVEQKQKQSGEQATVKATALRKVRTAIFAANRSVWISSCEACLFLETGGSAVQSHGDVLVHGRKGLYMMHECKRILNKQVAGEGLWHVDLSKSQNKQEGEVMEILPHDDALDDNVAAAGATEHSDGEDASDKPDEDAEDPDDAVNDEEIDADAKMAGDAKLPDIEETPDNPDDSAERQEHVTKDTTPLVGAAEHGDVAENATDQDKSKAQIFHITVSLRDDWLHRGDALQYICLLYTSPSPRDRG